MGPEFFFFSVCIFLNCAYGSNSVSAIFEVIFVIRLETTLNGLLIKVIDMRTPEY